MKIFKIVLLVALAISLQACNTMKGLGEDIQQGGKAIKKSAEANS